MTILGNVGKQPEIMQSASGEDGKKYARFSIATSEYIKAREPGQNSETRTQWHRVVAFGGPLVDFIANKVSAGTKLYVEGKLNHRSVTSTDGQSKIISEIVLSPYQGDIVVVSPPSSSASDKSASVTDSTNTVASTGGR